MDLSSLKTEILTIHAQLRDQGIEQKQAIDTAIQQAMARLSIVDTNSDFLEQIAELLADFDENDPDTKAMTELLNDPERFDDWITRDFGLNIEDASARLAVATEVDESNAASQQVLAGSLCAHLLDELPFYDCLHDQCEHECCRQWWRLCEAVDAAPVNSGVKRKRAGSGPEAAGFTI